MLSDKTCAASDNDHGNISIGIFYIIQSITDRSHFVIYVKCVHDEHSNNSSGHGPNEFHLTKFPRMKVITLGGGRQFTSNSVSRCALHMHAK